MGWVTHGARSPPGGGASTPWEDTRDHKGLPFARLEMPGVLPSHVRLPVPWEDWE
jgi:hypothetical protein